MPPFPPFLQPQLHAHNSPTKEKKEPSPTYVHSTRRSHRKQSNKETWKGEKEEEEEKAAERAVFPPPPVAYTIHVAGKDGRESIPHESGKEGEEKGGGGRSYFRPPPPFSGKQVAVQYCM